jgi:cyclopropane fatty-acyl-phospholipid synthase-like methyltransferase
VYATYFSASYAEVNPITDEGYQHQERVLRRALLPYLPTSRTAAILDVGCGVGYAVNMLLRAGYARTRGIDISPEQVEVARRRGLPVEEADAFAFLSNRHQEFDAILALDFIEHLDRDEVLSFFDLARAALRPGGRLIVRTANASSLLAGRSRYRDLTHEQVFTEHSLRAALQVCGFLPLVIRGDQYYPANWKGWVRKVFASGVRTLWKAYLIAELGLVEGRHIPTEFNLFGVAERR